MKILITGMAGFIGMHLAQALLDKGCQVVGIDNLTDITYEDSLKRDRLRALGLEGDFDRGCVIRNGALSFMKLSLNEEKVLNKLIAEGGFDAVVNLAALAGVRLSTERPRDYFKANAEGFFNLLEAIRACNNKPRLLFASSSSVYGDCPRAPFREDDRSINPISVYACTKTMNESLAFTYAKLYRLSAIGLRFFTVYGPWGRPDMAPFIFTKAILAGKPIRLFNHGKLRRDFTYVEDIVGGIVRMIEEPKVKDPALPFEIYNIGHGDPVELMDFIAALEQTIGKKAILDPVEMQPGDVHQTYADVTKLKEDYGYTADTPLEKGIAKFYAWFKDYYQID